MVRIADIMEDQIEEIVKELNSEHDVKRRDQLRSDLKEIARIRNEEIRMDYECNDRVERTLMDKANSEENLRLRKEQLEFDKANARENAKIQSARIKTDVITTTISVLVSVLGIVANGVLAANVMDFEKTGTIRSKAFQFVSKPNLFSNMFKKKI